MDLLGTKMLCGAILLVFSLIFGLMPLKLGKILSGKESKSSRYFLSILLCFGGGVLFATCFVHILPEVS